MGITKHKPRRWLFENDQTRRQYSERSINEFLKANARKAGITKRVHAHLLRHCYASHSILISGLYMVQEILGHSDPKITASTYIHNSPRLISQAYSPIDSLPMLQIRDQANSGSVRGIDEEPPVKRIPHDFPVRTGGQIPEVVEKAVEASSDRIYNVQLNGKTYLLKSMAGRIVEAPHGATWSIGLLAEKVLAWFTRKGATVNEQVSA